MKLEEYIQETIELFNANSENLDANIFPGVANTICRTVAMLSYSTKIDIEKKLKSSTPLSADSWESILHWGEISNTKRLQPKNATGLVNFNGLINNKIIPLGTEITTLDGKEYITTENTKIINNKAIAKIKSIEKGTEFNLNNGTKGTVDSVIDDSIDSYITFENVGGGSDLECFEHYKKRVIIAFESNYGQGTRCWLEYQVYSYSSEVEKVYLNKNGCCYDVFVIINNDVASNSDNTNIQQFLDEPCRISECICAEVKKLYSKDVVFSINSVSCDSITQDVRDRIEQEVNQFIGENAEIGQEVDHKSIENIVKNNLNESCNLLFKQQTLNNNEINIKSSITYV